MFLLRDVVVKSWISK